jgi:hypothetical protein
MNNTNGSPFVFHANNVHSDGCGKPPSVVADPSKYSGYFANRHGEQWVVFFDRNTGQGTFRGGDTGWDAVHAVIEGEADGLILNLRERVWLLACWHAESTHRPAAAEARLA